MTTYIAFLRAINVGGRGIVKMADLRNSFAAAGCKNVRTYIQSGNVVFECPEETSVSVFKRIYMKLRELLASEPGILFRTFHEVDRIVKAAPFKDFQNESGIKLYVVFFSEKPVAKPKLPISAKEALETIALGNREAFIISRRKPSGMFGFPNDFIAKELGVMATTRNWSTVTKLVEFARQPVDVH